MNVVQLEEELTYANLSILLYSVSRYMQSIIRGTASLMNNAATMTCSCTSVVNTSSLAGALFTDDDGQRKNHTFDTRTVLLENNK